MSNHVQSTIHADGYVTIKMGDVSKNISVEDYIKCLASLNKNLGGAAGSSESYRLPKGIHSFSKVSDGYVVNLYYPSVPAVIDLENYGKRTIRMPNVMIRVPLQNIVSSPGSFCLGKIKWYATPKSSTELPIEWPEGPTYDQLIHALPMPNMYSSGQMCTGKNVLPSVIYSDWSVLDMLYHDVLLGSKFNSDLNVPGVNGITSPSTWIKKLESIYKEDPEAFPYELLQ